MERLVYSVWNVYVSRFVGVECFRLAWARMELTRYWMLNVGLGPGGDHQVLNVGLGPGGAHQVLNVEFFWYDYAQPHLKGCYFVLLSGTASNMHAVSSWGSHFPHARGRIFKGSSCSSECNILSEHILPTKIFKFSWNTEISFLIKNDDFYKEERNTRTKVLKVS